MRSSSLDPEAGRVEGRAQLDGGGVIMVGSAGPDFQGPGRLGGVTQLVRITVTGLKAHRDRTKAALAVASEMQAGPPGWLRVTIGTPAEMTAFRDALGAVLGRPVPA